MAELSIIGLLIMFLFAIPVTLFVLPTVWVARSGALRALARGVGILLVLALVVGAVSLVSRNIGFGREQPLKAAIPSQEREPASLKVWSGEVAEAGSIPLEPAASDENRTAAKGQGDLSVVYIDYERRPDWVESTPIVDSGKVDRIAVSSGPWVLRRESVKALDAEIKLAADQYINEQVGNDAAATMLRYDVSTLKRRVIGQGQTFEEVIEVSVGPMHQMHALLEFDPAFRQEVNARWGNIVATSRLLQTGLGAAAVLGLLGVAFGYLRLDTATRGYYTRRLRFATLVAILTLVAAGTLVASWIPWI